MTTTPKKTLDRFEEVPPEFSNEFLWVFIDGNIEEVDCIHRAGLDKFLDFQSTYTGGYI